MPALWSLLTLQDELGARSFTGGASVGDHRLLAGNRSGLIAGVFTCHIRTHDFAWSLEAGSTNSWLWLRTPDLAHAIVNI